MDVKELMGVVVEELYAGLTGGSAELPLPPRTKINWVFPGIPFHASFFDFAISGPFAGPSPATLADFEELMRTIEGQGNGNGAGNGNGGNGGAPMDRAQVLEEAKRMYQQHLLGSWEQWSRLVDFIPLMSPTPAEMSWKATDNQGSQGHKGVVYGQAGQTLSQVYKDTLERCLVAEEALTAEQQAVIERMRKLLQVEVEREDFLTGEVKKEVVESPAMTIYNEKKLAYENAVVDYAARLARAQTGTAADVIEWTRSGGVFKQRALQARRDWTAIGNKNAIEEAQSVIAHITGGNMGAWKQALLDNVIEIEENVSGAFGYPFFPATVLPGAFARSGGWTHYSQRNLKQRVTSRTSTQSGGASGGLSLGFFTIGGSGGGSRQERSLQIQRDDFGLEFDYTQVEICRPAFNPNFFLSRGWKPRDSFVADHGAVHSDGKPNPTGAFVGYPTKALFIRNLRIYSSELAQTMRDLQTSAHGGGMVGIGPFMIGGSYAQTNRQRESNLEIDNAGITVRGMSLVAFLSALFPATSNPNPAVQNWV
jgi:hypothetical protein